MRKTRPAVTWRAMGEMKITAPGAGYTLDSRKIKKEEVAAHVVEPSHG